MMRKKSSLFICLLFCYSCLRAQNFTVKANLQPVTISGFYSVNITPQLSSYTTINFSDLRIADDNNKFVPYIISSKKPSFATGNYHKLPLLKNDVTGSGKSQLIIKNDAGSKISSIALLIRNAAVNRQATISGSDDLTKWFTINENITLEDISGNDTDRHVQTISFPVSSYKFFKIIIDNKKNNPLNIIEAGSYSNVQHTEDAYILNPLPAFTQIDSSDNITYIKVHQNAAYHVSKIYLQAESPKFFDRNIDVINSANSLSAKLSSENTNEITLPAFNDKDWEIKIYNGDNPPLKIKSISLKQESKNIIAYLQTGQHYHLLLHDSTAVAPVYDLQNFKDSIPATLPQLKIISFENISPATIKNKTGLSAAWIWILIISALTALGFITFMLMKEMNKEK